MKVTRKQLKRLIQEELAGSGRISYLYHGSKQPPDILIPVFLNDEFKPGLGEDALFVVDELNNKNATSTGHYGEWIYKLRVNLYGFLITDLSLAKHVYGENFMPSDQILLITGKHNLANDARKKEEQWFALSPQLRKVYDIVNDSLIGKLFKGVINQHGVGIIYDYSKVVPIAYKKVNDIEFTKVPMNDLSSIKNKIGQSSNVYSKRRNEWDKSLYDLMNDF